MLKLAAIFTDNMVLQRGKKIAVWGNTDSNAVHVKVIDASGAVISSGYSDVVLADHSFKLTLSEMDAGGPYSMIVTSGDDKLTFENIMLGDVFLAGGQSNMELELQNSLDGASAVAEALAKNVRFYYTPKCAWVGDALYAEEALSAWELCTSEHCGRWSAVAYYFAKKLSEELNITIGIIGCNWGGTSASCWMSRESLEAIPELAPYLEDYDRATAGQSLAEYIKEYEDYVVYQANFDKNVSEYYQTAENPSWDEAISLFGENKYPGPMGPRNWTRPAGLYETMISRVAPYTLNGFIFYQGEEDDHRPQTYKLLLEALVGKWRHDWSDESLPFMIVQLPVFLGEGGEDFMNWPLIREAQMDAVKELDNMGIAVTLELGDKQNIHPLDKKNVGIRLANQALCHIYKSIDETKAYGPVYSGYRVEGNKIRIAFDHAQDGFLVKGDKIENFEIAGMDKIYYPADAVIDGTCIVLSSQKVEAPSYARYCWRNYCEVNLFGVNKIPAAPFRTSRDDGAKPTGSRNGLMV